TRAKEDFVRSLMTLAMDVYASAAPYFLVRVGNGACFRENLLRQGILVRDAASFGLPAFVRLATRLPEQNARIVEALALIAKSEQHAYSSYLPCPDGLERPRPFSRPDGHSAQ